VSQLPDSPLNATAPTYQYHVIIPRARRPQVFLQFRDDHWYLPQWEEHERRFWQSVDHVNQAVRDRFGLTVTTLRCLDTTYDAPQNVVRRLYEMENRSEAWSPSGRDRWIGRDMLDGLSLGIPEHRAVLEAWFAEEEQGKPSQRRPWARRGWLDATTNWIRDQLRQRGITFQRIEQLRTWERSCLLRVQTDAGDLYFKAVPSMFAHEPPLTKTLAEWLPGRFPDILAVDSAQHWMLMEDFGGQSLEHEHDITRWEAAARQFAEMQIGLALRSPELIALGCPDRPVSELPDQIDALLADDATLMVGAADGLSEETVALLRARAAEFRAQCEELVALDIPSSLEHGDLWASNIVLREQGFLFFDWSDSAITHPFFSLLFFMEDAREAFPALPDAPQRIRDAYLAAWGLYRPMEDLLAAFRLAQTLAPLHHAVTYHRYILPHMKMRWEMSRMVPFYLNMVVREGE
jgi:aminoglycoside/choline kinase family phosphotransferase